MRCLSSFLFAAFVPISCLADEIPGTLISHGNWSGAGYTFDDGTFSHCVVSAQYNHGNTLFFSVNIDASVRVGVSTPAETFSPLQEFPVALYVDCLDSGFKCNG